MATLPYEMQYRDGVIMRVTSLEDLIKLRRADLDKVEAPRAAQVSRAEQPSAPRPAETVKTGWEGFVDLLEDPAYLLDLKFATILASHPKGIEIPKIAKALDTSEGGIGARRANLGRMCTSNGLDKDKVLTRKGNRYFPGELLTKNELPPVPPPEAGK